VVGVVHKEINLSSPSGIIHSYRIEGYFPEVHIFPTREPSASAENFPIQKFPSSALNQTHVSNFLAPVNAK